MPGIDSRDITSNIKESVCIHTSKIYDSCRDKDCIEDLRVYPTFESQRYIDEAISVRPKSAELLYASIDVEEVAFNQGYYSIDVRYYYKIKGDAFALLNRSNEISGLAVFDKRVILFGSEGNAKIYSSNNLLVGNDLQALPRTNLPTAVVEVVDPIALGMRIVDICDVVPYDNDQLDVPEFIQNAFSDRLNVSGESRRLYVTLGQFSIVRLERDTQLCIPTYSYCIPDKECVDTNNSDPCDVFRRINFPVDEFFPPNTISSADNYKEARAQVNG